MVQTARRPAVLVVLVHVRPRLATVTVKTGGSMKHVTFTSQVRLPD